MLLLRPAVDLGKIPNLFSSKLGKLFSSKLGKIPEPFLRKLRLRGACAPASEGVRKLAGVFYGGHYTREAASCHPDYSHVLTPNKA